MQRTLGRGEGVGRGRWDGPIVEVGAVAQGNVAFTQLGVLKEDRAWTQWNNSG